MKLTQRLVIALSTALIALLGIGALGLWQLKQANARFEYIQANIFPSLRAMQEARGFLTNSRMSTYQHALMSDPALSRTISVSPDAIGPFGYSLISKDGPFQISNTFTNLGVGIDPAILSRSFKVFVRDGNGCIDSCEFTVLQPQKLSCALDKTDLTCFLNGSGSVTATISGGTLPYRYVWSNGSSEGPTASTEASISGLSAGTYGLTVTDANNCTTTCSITVNQPTPVTATLDPVTVCLDFDTQLSLSPSGGTGNYTYAWTMVDAGTTYATVDNLTGDLNTQTLDFTSWCLKPGIATINVVVTTRPRRAPSR